METRNAFFKLTRFKLLIGLFALVAAFFYSASSAVGPESVTTFAPDCVTAKSSFSLGETVCAKVTGAPLGPPAQRRINWINPAGIVVRAVDVTSDPQSDLFTLPTTNTSVFGGLTVDNRGTWRVNLVTVADASVRTTAFFTVQNPSAPSVDLSISKFGPAEISAGQNITFTVLVANRGPDGAQNVQLTDAVPANTTFVSGVQTSGPPFSLSNPSAGGTGITTCSIGSLPAGSTATFVFVYNVAPGVAVGDTISNTASISSSTSEAHDADNTSTVEVTVTQQTCSLTCPSNITTAKEQGQCGASVNYPAPTPSGSGCGTITCTPPSGSFFPLGTTTVSCIGDNGDPCSFTVTVDNTQSTSIICPANITTSEAFPGIGFAVVDYPAPTFNDNCSLPASSCSPPTGSVFPVGTTTVTCSASIASGSTSCSFTVTVTGLRCTITCPGDVSIFEDTPGSGAALVQYSTPVTDGDCEGAVVSCSPPSGSSFPLGTTTVNCTADDPSNASCSFTVTVERTPACSLICPPDVTAVEDLAGSGSAIVRYGDPTPSSTCPPLTITCSPASGSSFPVGTTTVTCTGSDGSGTTATCSFTVTVNQATPCTISCPANVTQGNDPDQCGAVVEYPAPTTSGACGEETVTCSPPSGSFFPVGSTTVTCTTAVGPQCTFTVTVEDRQIPSISCPPNISVEGNVQGQCSATANPGTPTATDNCPGVSVVGLRSDNLPLTDPYPPGTTTIIWTATDASGGRAQCSSTVEVTNPSPAVIITAPASGAVFPVGTPVTFTGSFVDNAGGTHSAEWTFDSISQPGSVNEATGDVTTTFTFNSAGVYVVTLTVNDGCGGTGSTDTVDGLTAMVVIFDPEGAFVTGGGWINSPPGAFVADPSLTGKANFGFVSKYHNGASTPSGETEFQLRVADFNFHSTSYAWLVVEGPRAQYRGSGTVNGGGRYAFIVTVIDGHVSGGGGVDRFRIKIWNKDNGNVVFDTQPGDPDTADPSVTLGGGNIVIH